MGALYSIIKKKWNIRIWFALESEPYYKLHCFVDKKKRDQFCKVKNQFGKGKGCYKLTNLEARFLNVKVRHIIRHSKTFKVSVWVVHGNDLKRIY